MVEGSFIKDPDAVLDYAFNWARDWMQATDTIVSYVTTVETGLVKDSDNESNGIVTVWLSGGTAGASYIVACKVTTAMGRTDERSIVIQCRQR